MLTTAAYGLFRDEQSDIDMAKYCTSVETTPNVFHISMLVLFSRNSFLAATLSSWSDEVPHRPAKACGDVHCPRCQCGLVLRKRNCEAADSTVEHVSRAVGRKVQGLLFVGMPQTRGKCRQHVSHNAASDSCSGHLRLRGNI